MLSKQYIDSQYKQIAQCFDNLNDYQNAIIYYEKLLPTNDYKIYGNLVRMYSELYTFGYETKQIEYVNKAYELNPNDNINVLNKCLVYSKFNLPGATVLWDKALKINSSPSMLFSYGCFLIHNGNFKEGFRYYENRYTHNNDIVPKGLKNLWSHNIDIKGKIILVAYEQGFGDTIMFIRFIKDLIPLCKQVKILVQKELLELLKLNFDYDFYTDEDIPNLKYDYCIPIMSLPLLLNLNPKHISNQPYLDIEVKKEKSSKLKIGISFEGNIDGIRTCRDIPLKELYPIMDLPNIEIYSFQKDDRLNQLESVPSNYNIIKLGHTFNSFTDTAKAMKQMDIFITTDNVLLNLAGALGIKTFALFNKYPEFRWFKLPNSVAWYDIEPFQCKEFNKWNVPVQKIIKKLKTINI